VRELEKLIAKAIEHRGFSVVEVMANCHTSYGRMNKFATPVDMLRWMKDSAVSVARAKDMSEEELEGKFTRGVIRERRMPEFIEVYDQLGEKLTETPSAIAGVKKLLESYDRMADRLKV